MFVLNILLGLFHLFQLGVNAVAQSNECRIWDLQAVSFCKAPHFHFAAPFAGNQNFPMISVESPIPQSWHTDCYLSFDRNGRERMQGCISLGGAKAINQRRGNDAGVHRDLCKRQRMWFVSVKRRVALCFGSVFRVCGAGVRRKGERRSKYRMLGRVASVRLESDLRGALSNAPRCCVRDQGRFGLWPERLIVDTAYGSEEKDKPFSRAMAASKGIARRPSCPGTLRSPA